MVDGLEKLATPEASKLAFNVASTWINSNYMGFKETGQIFEKVRIK